MQEEREGNSTPLYRLDSTGPRPHFTHLAGTVPSPSQCATLMASQHLSTPYAEMKTRTDHASSSRPLPIRTTRASATIRRRSSTLRPRSSCPLSSRLCLTLSQSSLTPRPTGALRASAMSRASCAQRSSTSSTLRATLLIPTMRLEQAPSACGKTEGRSS